MRHCGICGKEIFDIGERSVCGMHGNKGTNKSLYKYDTKITCPNCGDINPSLFAYCSKCGTSLKGQKPKA